jgi:hypothetical protein
MGPIALSIFFAVMLTEKYLYHTWRFSSDLPDQQAVKNSGHAKEIKQD